MPKTPSKKEVRLIVKVELESGLPLVIRFKNESDVTIEIIESQSCFADVMRKNGILAPYQYQSGGAFAKWYQINGYDVIVTVEQFAENEIKLVDAMIAEKTGELLARMHSISEENNLHVCNKVLFDPFAVNELFDFESFKSLETALSDNESVLFDKIVQKYNAYMDVLAPLKRQSKYAVQGDISSVRGFGCYHGWHERHPGGMDWRAREQQILAECVERPQKQGSFGRLSVLCRRFERIRGGIGAVYPHSQVQRCIVHQIRSSTRFVSYKDIKPLMADLKKVYTAATENEALENLVIFKEK